MKNIFIGVCGASGAKLGIKLAQEASKTSQVHLCVSQSALNVIECEDKSSIEIDKLKEFGIEIYDNNDLSARVSSGSFLLDCAIIAPCSINTLAKISNGFADTLITRVSAVALKQRTRLILGAREMPFSTISLEQLNRLSLFGAIIAPPVIAYYSDIKNLDDLENFIIGKWLDLAGIENQIYKRWKS